MGVNLGSAYGEIVISTDKAESNISSLGSKLTSVGATMSAAITAPLAGVAAAGIKATMQFSQSMNTLQTVSGATGAAMERIQATALQLGKDTSFSANEAAAGMLELAKAGFSAEQTIASIGGVLDLAAAGELSVASAAEIAANAINAFKLPVEQTSKVAGIFAAAANASSIEVTDMAQAFQQAASSFASNGQSVGDLSTALAILGNNGIKGSDAGTLLKTTMQRLTAPTGAAAKELRKMGVSVFDASGQMRPFGDIMDDLAVSAEGMSDAQRAAAFNTIFGSDAIRAANIFADEGAGAFDRMAESVNKAGAAQEVADSKMRGLAGAIKYAQGTIESTLIAAFLPLEDMASGLVRSFADLVGKFVDLPAPVQRAAMAFAAVLAAAGPLMLALRAIGTVIGALLSPLGLVSVAVAALAAAWVTDWGGIQKKTFAVLNAIQDRIKPVIGWLRQFGDAVRNLLTGRDFGDLMTRVRAAFQNVADAVRGFFSGSLSFDGLRTALVDGMRAIADAVVRFFGGQDFSSFLSAINWDNFIAKLSDWGTYITSLDWGGYITKLTDWGLYIGKLAWASVLSFGTFLWSDYISKIDWSALIPDLSWGSFIDGTVIWSAYLTALVWNAFVSTLNWGLHVNKLVWTELVPSINWRAVVTYLIWGEYINSIVWWNFITPLLWDTYLGYVEWTNYIKQLFWEQLIPQLNWPDFANMLTWGEFVNAVDWVAFIPLLAWSTWLVQLVWPNFISSLEWAAWLVNLIWSNFIDRLNLPSFVTKLLWTNHVTRVNLPGFVGKLLWGSFVTAVRLGAFVPFLNWFSFVTGVNLRALVPAFPGWSAFVGAITGNAVGTTFFEGGATLVGERGPELVTLPRGSRIDTAPKTRAILQGAQGAGEMVVNQTLQFFGNADPAMTRKAADSGLRDAAFALGVNLA